MKIVIEGATARADGPVVRDRDWQALLYFCMYRTVLAGLLSGLSLWGGMSSPIGEPKPELFRTVALGYLLISVTALVLVGMRRPGFSALVLVQGFLDIFALSILIHATGGLASGFGMLLLVAIAGGSILSGRRIAVLFASMAALCVLAERVFTSITAPWIELNYPHSGMLGAAFFATAFLANYSATRLRVSEALAARRELDLADLGRLNEHIVQRMQSGIVVVGTNGEVRLANKSAARLIGVTDIPGGAMFYEFLPSLAKVQERWEQAPEQGSFLIVPPASQLTVQVSFAGLAEGRDGVLIFLEDNAAILQRVQELKLASLGRLAGSIAHEIRNPLSAISHANGLLSESPSVSPGDRRLMEIVSDNARRMNDIVESVLRLSRRVPSDPHQIEVREWLGDFCKEFCRTAELDHSQVDVEVSPSDLRIRLDTGQIRQVLWNLCENGLQHGDGARVRIGLIAGLDTESKRPFLDVFDDGPGIPREHRERLFEPFFTTRAAGTGLGLYVARELCEANQATLNHRDTNEGCCFRIIFADQRRVGAIPG